MLFSEVKGSLLIFKKNLPHVKVWMTNIGKWFQMKIAFRGNDGNEVPFLETVVHEEVANRLCENTEKAGHSVGSKSSQ